MEDYKPVTTPMQTSCKLSKDDDSKLIDIFWTQAVHTIVHIQNRVMLKNNTDKNPYSYGKEDQQMRSTSRFLEANATSKEEME